MLRPLRPGARRADDRSPTIAAAAALGLCLLASGCGPAPADRPRQDENDRLTVFAAASLRDLVGDLSVLWEAGGGEPLAISSAGSNVLARQLLARPAADVFLSADRRWMDELEAAGRLLPGSRRTWLSNRLVVIAHRDSLLATDGLADPRRLATLPYRHLALADPRGVPAGRYAREWLESVPAAPRGDDAADDVPGDGADSLWQGVVGRVAPAADVRAALALVEADPEILGIVYRTDARTSERVRVIWEVGAAAPGGTAPAVEYVAAALAATDRPAAARRLLDFLEGRSDPAVAAAIERHGFALPRR